MSVQLILYPQSYNGQYNAVSNVASEKVVDGITFNSINLSSSYDSPTVSLSDPVLNAPPTLINTWYRFRSTVTGTPTLPTASGGDLELYSDTTNTISGVYQRLSNLIVSQIYNVHILLDNSASGTLTFTAYNGNLGGVPIANVNYTISSLVGNFATFQFTAATTQDFIQITYTNSVAQTFTITDISVLPYFTVPTFTNFSLEDGQVICDLYQEEDIPLTLSVDEFKNVAEQVHSYSKDFNLPATKRNNQIFDNIFEITRSDDGVIFNPYIKTQCVLKQDGYILFEGYLRLIDIQDQEGEISYNVNLYSEVVALADVLKDKTFNDISFLELKHDYDKDGIKDSWTGTLFYLNSNTSGFRDGETLKYPFVDWTHQILVSNGVTGTAGYPQLGNLEQAFRPFINLKYLINRIFQDTPFTWSSTFFDSADFGKMYMDFNWGANEWGSIPDTYNAWGDLRQKDSQSTDYFINTYGWKKLRFDATVSGDNSLWNNTDYKFTSAFNNLEVTVGYFIALKSVATVSTYSNNLRIAKFDSAGNVLEVFEQDDDSIAAGDHKIMGSVPSGPSWGGINNWSSQFSTVLNLNEYIQVQSKVQTDNKIRMSNFYESQLYFDWNSDDISTDALLSSAREGVGQWEFLKGIMTMFNLITLPDKENPLNIIFETYDDVFINDTIGTTLAARSIQHDWTEKVDVSEMKLLPLTDLNKETIFKFVEDDSDYAFNVYKKSTNHLYGSKIYDASDYTILSGVDEIIAEPFAATVQKRLMSQYSNIVIPTIYSMAEDRTTTSFDNSPRIMYNNGVKSTGITYYIPAQNGKASENQANFLQFSHLSNIPTVTGTLDFNFETHQLLDGVGNPVPDNLFNLYWLPYYNELYNPNTRIMTLKVNLTAADINTFEFNDKVLIKNTVFRVNKIEYKPNNLATVEFILIP